MSQQPATGRQRRNWLTETPPTESDTRKEEKMSPVLPISARNGFEGRRPARGYVDETVYVSNVVKGWILLPDAELTSVQVYANGVLVGSAKIQFNQEIADLYPRIPHAGRSGFRINLKPGQLKTRDVTRVTVIGYQGGQPLARMETLLFPKELIPTIPVPPLELIEKVQGDQDGEAYRTLGFRYYRQFLDVIGRYRDLRTVRRLLDWGCGSGRVAAAFLAAGNGPEVCGADIDAEAVAWCQANLRAGHYTHTAPEPPLPFPDATFEAVISLAVLAGFGPDAYDAWLPELSRVLGPGGLVLASVQGAFAASFEFPPETVPELLHGGIFDGGRCETADPLHAEGQWRGYYLTPEYVRREWSKYFEILEYLEGEINADQDLLVLRRTARSTEV
jgi:SAM-dependent methyltransferase